MDRAGTARWVAEIYNAAWYVREARPGSPRSAQAVLRLGLTVRQAFLECEELEPLLYAVADGLSVCRCGSGLALGRQRVRGLEPGAP